MHTHTHTDCEENIEWEDCSRQRQKLVQKPYSERSLEYFTKKDAVYKLW